MHCYQTFSMVSQLSIWVDNYQLQRGSAWTREAAGLLLGGRNLQAVVLQVQSWLLCSCLCWYKWRKISQKLVHAGKEDLIHVFLSLVRYWIEIDRDSLLGSEISRDDTPWAQILPLVCLEFEVEEQTGAAQPSAWCTQWSGMASRTC
jgi:hypothetical protein